jgi:hypothetical protein
MSSKLLTLQIHQLESLLLHIHYQFFFLTLNGHTKHCKTMGIQNTARQIHIRVYFITLFIEGKNRDEIYYINL